MNGIRRLINSGFTNAYTEDLNDIATAKIEYTYEWYCSSPKCCSIELKKNNGKKTSYLKAKVFKLRTNNSRVGKCPDCNQMLFSKKVKR